MDVDYELPLFYRNCSYDDYIVNFDNEVEIEPSTPEPAAVDAGRSPVPLPAPHLKRKMGTLSWQKRKVINRKLVFLDDKPCCRCTKPCNKAYCACVQNKKSCSLNCGQLGCCNSQFSPVKEKPHEKKAGCKCKASGCLKKYCECFAGNGNCGELCRCISCKNVKIV
jgi:hypothetical protein